MKSALGVEGRSLARLWWVVAALVAVTVLGAREAGAVPSFARQTGLACSSCHTTFPELTAFGRAFKMHGYTTLGMKEFEEAATDKDPQLLINRAFPLSVMLQTSVTRTDRKQPGTQNGDVEFPQALSLFLAGEITPHIGAFVQATYDGQGDHFTLDNTDIRYVRTDMIGDRELLYGITLNNNPTVEDPWNSTPAWGFPFAAADNAPTPSAAAAIDGGLAQQVGGAGVYTLFDKHLYADVTLYRSAHIGEPSPPTTGETLSGTIKDVAPYWRLAWQQNFGPNYLEVGTYGIWAQIFPPGSVHGDFDQFSDYAFDSQFERPFGKDFLSTHLTYIYENRQNDGTQAAGGATNHNDKLHTLRLDGIYHWRDRVEFALGWFWTRGTNDPLLFAPEAVTGSRDGNPDSDGFRAEVGWHPWQNVRLSLQYTAYTEFNGHVHNYDGSGRDSWDNNTLYLLAWLMY